MPVSAQMLGVKGDECPCGRRATIRHCPSCGSSRIYGRTGRMHTFLSGETKLVQTEFRCQACTHLFIDEERIFCEAPAVGQKLAAMRVRALHDASQTGEYLTPVERKAAESILKAVRAGQSLEDAEPNPDIKAEMSAKDLTRLEWDLRRAWADTNIAFKMKRSNVDPGRWQSYVKEKMKELGIDWSEKVEESEVANAPERITNEEAEKAQ